MTSVYLIAISFSTAYTQKDSTRAFTAYYPDSTVFIETFKKNGKIHGPYTSYFRNGNKKYQTFIVDDIQNGDIIKWDSNGNIEYTGRIQNDLEEGEWKYYDSDDQKIHYSVTYEKGKRISYKYYSEKYKWRTIHHEGLDIQFQFPTSEKSVEISKDIIGYWSMLPYIKKEELEYYSVIKFPYSLFTLDFEEIKESLKNNELTPKLRLLFKGSSNNEDLPSIYADDFKVLSSGSYSLSGNEVLVINSIYNNIDLRFTMYLIKIEEYVYGVAAYYNEEKHEFVKKQFFDKIILK